MGLTRRFIFIPVDFRRVVLVFFAIIKFDVNSEINKSPLDKILLSETLLWVNFLWLELRNFKVFLTMYSLNLQRLFEQLRCHQGFPEIVETKWLLIFLLSYPILWSLPSADRQ